MKNKIKSILQIAFVVPDIEKIVQFYSDVLGFDQWERTFVDEEALRKYPHYSRGEDMHATFKVAKGMVGDIEFEFMQPVEGESIYMESLRANNDRPHLHHLFVEMNDFDEVYKEMSSKYEKLQEGITPFGSKIVYFDTQDDMGFIMETGIKKKRPS